MHLLLKITCNETGKIFIAYTTQKPNKYLRHIRHKKRKIEKGLARSTTQTQLSFDLSAQIIAVTTDDPAKVRQQMIELYPECINDREYSN